jgi:nitrile hydratase accessory protein
LSPPEQPEEPVFAEPWQARAFALALKLAQQGHFTSSEWTTALSRQVAPAGDSLASRSVAGDDGSHYYEHWLTALEKLVVDKGLADTSALNARKEAWRDAYLHTPHGQPVELPVPVRKS